VKALDEVEDDLRCGHGHLPWLVECELIIVHEVFDSQF